MKRKLRSIIAGCCLSLVLVVPVSAEESTLKLQVFPEQCSIDELQTGPGYITQITPETCIPPEPSPEPSPDVPEEVVAPSRTSSQSTSPVITDKQTIKNWRLYIEALQNNGYESVQVSDYAISKSDEGDRIKWYIVLLLLSLLILIIFLLIRRYRRKDEE